MKTYEIEIIREGRDIIRDITIPVGPKDFERINTDYNDTAYGMDYSKITHWNIIEERFEGEEDTAVYVNLIAEDGTSPSDTAFYDWQIEPEDSSSSVNKLVAAARADEAYRA